MASGEGGDMPVYVYVWQFLWDFLASFSLDQGQYLNKYGISLGGKKDEIGQKVKYPSYKINKD